MFTCHNYFGGVIEAFYELPILAHLTRLAFLKQSVPKIYVAMLGKWYKQKGYDFLNILL